VRELDLMSAEELQQVTSWSKGAVDSIDRTFRCPEMISVWAEQQPDAVAIAMEDAQLTYGELESQSDQVASQLLSCGVGHERRAGFFFNRTPELLIGLIASLKANTVYVPLDPGHPAGRIAEIVAHAQLDLVVTSPELLSRAPNLGARVIAIGAEADSTRTDV